MRDCGEERGRTEGWMERSASPLSSPSPKDDGFGVESRIRENRVIIRWAAMQQSKSPCEGFGLLRTRC